MPLLGLPEWHTIGEFYNNLTLHIVPGPRSLSYFLPFVLVISALLTPPRLLSRNGTKWIVLPLIIGIQLHVWVKYKSFDVISSNGLLTAFMFLGWYDVRKDFKYIHRLHTSPPGPSAPKLTSTGAEAGVRDVSPATIHGTDTLYWSEPYPSTLISRMRWVGILMSSMRLTDWHIGLPSHDRKQPAPIQPFWKFVRETLLQGGFAYILLDFTSPYLLTSGTGAALVTELSLLNQITRSLILLAHFYAALTLLLAVIPYLVSASAIFVAPSLRSNSLISPLTWPSHLGPLSSIYSESSSSQNTGLRAFWGIFWHQNMRYITSTPGITLASCFNLDTRSKVRYFMMVTSSFLFSGIIHMGVVPSEPLGASLSMWSMRLRVASFFWLQVAGIIIEDLVQSSISARDVKSASRQKDTKSDENPEAKSVSLGRKCLVLMWTIGFLAFTAWWTVLPVACELGWLRMRFIPVSISRYLLV